jgi:hypothetical protein
VTLDEGRKAGPDAHGLHEPPNHLVERRRDGLHLAGDHLVQRQPAPDLRLERAEHVEIAELGDDEVSVSVS